MKQRDLSQFKFSGRKCTGFYLSFNGLDIIFIRDVEKELKNEFSDVGQAGDIWRVNVLNMPSLLPIEFQTSKRDMSLVKVAEYGLSYLLGQIRQVESELEELAVDINKELMRSEDGK